MIQQNYCQNFFNPSPESHLYSRIHNPIQNDGGVIFTSIPVDRSGSAARPAVSIQLGLKRRTIMLTPVNHLKLMSNSFDKLHEQLSVLVTHVKTLNDPEAEELLKQMEIGLLAPMRRLRHRLEIPYDWHEKTEQREVI